MPTYQYQCTECGEGLEAVQKFTDDALTECPSCSGRLRKVFSAVGVVFKGSGFYRTDSRGGSSGGSPVAKGTASSDGDSSRNGSGGDGAKGGGEKAASSTGASSSSSSSSSSSGSASGSSAA